MNDGIANSLGLLGIDNLTRGTVWKEIGSGRIIIQYEMAEDIIQAFGFLFHYRYKAALHLNALSQRQNISVGIFTNLLFQPAVTNTTA